MPESPFYGDGVRAVWLTAPDQTRNQARSNLVLPPLSEDAPESGDEVLDSDDFDARAEAWASAHAADLVSGLKERTTGMLDATLVAALARVGRGSLTAK